MQVLESAQESVWHSENRSGPLRVQKCSACFGKVENSEAWAHAALCVKRI